MRTISLTVQTEVFNKLSTPSTLRFEEPKEEDIYSIFTVTGEDDDLWKCILEAVEMDDPDMFLQYIEQDAEGIQHLLDVMDVTGMQRPRVTIVHFFVR